MRVFKFAVLATKKRRAEVFGGDVLVAPLEVRFDVVHISMPEHCSSDVVCRNGVPRYFRGENTALSVGKMKPDIIKIIVTGPESSGKTTLAAALTAELDTGYVPEFARTYLAHLGRPYERNDLKIIYLGQIAWEDWYAQQLHLSTAPLLICDTDWTVIHVWEQYKFERKEFEVRSLKFEVGEPSSAGSRTSNFKLQTSNPLELQTLYFLCSPDIPWQPDPLREHPAEREVLFEMYEDLLRNIQARYVIMRGTPAQRLENALAAIREVL